MACYFVAQLNVHDPDRYARYLEGTAEQLEMHGGRLLAVDLDPAVLEGEWPYGRTVIIEFPSRDHLDAWYGSEGYRRIAEHRHAAATGNVVALEGR
jgi:uncharacterized protein (DUF1330 family)